MEGTCPGSFPPSSFSSDCLLSPPRPTRPLHTRGRWPNMDPTKVPWSCKEPGRGGKLPACCVWPRRQMPNVKEGVASSPPGFPRQRSVVQASSARPVACFSTLLLHTTNTVAQDWLILHTLLTLYQQQCIKLPWQCIVACPVLSCCPALANSYYSATMVPQ